MPFYASPQFHLNDRFMLASTRFWKPMLNGYSGFKPASFYKNVEALRSFPDEGSIAHLRALGVTHVVVDGRNMAPAALERLEKVSRASDADERRHLAAVSADTGQLTLVR